MNNSKAIVTAGGSGLGAVISDHLHRDECHVIIIDRDESAGSQLADRLGESPGATFIECDLLDRAQLRQTVLGIAASGPLSLLVNNAGGWLPGAQLPDSDQWEDSLELNLHVPMLLTKIAIPALSKAGPDGGAVVNIAIQRRMGFPCLPVARIRGRQGRPHPLQHSQRQSSRARDPSLLHHSALDRPRSSQGRVRTNVSIRS